MNRKLIRLTESDLHRIIKESVKKILKEINKTEKEKDEKKGFVDAQGCRYDKRYTYDELVAMGINPVGTY